MALWPVGLRTPKMPYGSSINKAACDRPRAQQKTPEIMKTKMNMRKGRIESIRLPLG
jgi:hypothetical protein